LEKYLEACSNCLTLFGGLLYAGFSKWRRYGVIEYSSPTNLNNMLKNETQKMATQGGLMEAAKFHRIAKSKQAMGRVESSRGRSIRRRRSSKRS
jgi:hypothetical protein